MDLQTYFLIFIVYAVLGWVVESSYAAIKHGRVVNRGFLIGPWLPIYGCGALAITILLDKYTEDPLVLFVMSMIVCSALEYMTSYILEKIFKARWWDYSDNKYNINGRICLETMIPFGLMAILVMYIINPFVINIIDKVSYLWVNIISVVFFISFIIDNIISFKLANDLKTKTFKENEDNTEEINQVFKTRIKEHKEKLSILNRRIIDAFPHVKWITKNHK